MHPPPPSPTLLADEDRYGALAQAMVQTQLRSRGIDHPAVLEQMRRIPRHLFVEDSRRSQAYDDCALPTCHGQTISQPYIVALMTQMLQVQPHHRVLEIGTGSGYQTMILSALAGQVFTIEQDADLLAGARRTLHRLGAHNVHFRLGDGSLGWPEHAPFDRILVTAAAPAAPPSLLAQLSDNGGRLVIPIGNEQVQNLYCFCRQGDNLARQKGIAVRFVPLVGREGWPASPQNRQ